MAEQQTPLKRQREETQSSEECLVVEETTKRHKSYNHILSLLEAEEDEPNQDLSSLITSLQQELSSSDSVLDETSLPCPKTTNSEADQDNNPSATANAAAIEDDSSATSCLKEEEDQDDKERVIRHLLEASDDELGIPNREEDVVVEFEEEGFNNGGNGFGFCDGLWELEDEAANYYTLLQSELFM
ncbi:hypothetical protein CCACVL1_06603 [Corchorus capsularis]|uniref:Uncharacterized protein n=1 Tax=Corchorus capsularis TaxID=210143 RepID=A0A1R3JE88_COCAP|nr:hypothetical protein CCACVL1_06603 [Corchorus capsularis]